MTKTTKTKSKSKRPQNTFIDERLAEMAKQYFPNTRYRNISGFLEAALLAKLRKERKALKKLNITVPAELFA